MPLYPEVTAGGGGAPTTASYLVLGADGTLSAERVLTAGEGITLTDAGAGSTLTVARTQKEVWGVVAADIGVTGTTLTDDTGLVVPISASATELWQFELQLYLSSTDTTADWKFGWATVPTSATIRWAPHMSAFAAATSYFDPSSTAASPPALLTEASVPTYGSAAVNHGVYFRGWIFGGGTGGNVQFQHARNGASGTATVLKGSCLIARRLVP